MKKLLVLLVTAMMLVVMVACANNGDTADTPDPPDAADAADTADAEDTTDVEDTDDNGDAAEVEAPPVAEGEVISLDFMHFWDRDGDAPDLPTLAYFDLSVRWFDEHPNVHINEMTMSHDDFLIMAQTQAAANDLPDMFFMRAQWLETWTDSGLVADITDLLMTYPRFGDFAPGILNEITRDGRVYGVPIQGQASTSIMFYNAALWAEAGFDTFPDTWEEIVAASEIFNEMGIDTIVSGNQDGWVLTNNWVSNVGVRMLGTDWVDGIASMDGSADFYDPKFLELMYFTQELGQSGVMNRDMNSIDNGQAYDLFGHGQAASLAGGFWVPSHLLTTADEEVLEHLRITVMPEVPGATAEPRNTVTSTAGWFVSFNSNLDSARLEAGVAFTMDVLGSDEFSTFIAEGGGIPTMVTEEVDLSDHPLLRQQFIAHMRDSNHTLVWDMVLNPALQDELNIVVQEVTGGMLTPEEAVQRMQDKLESLQ